MSTVQTHIVFLHHVILFLKKIFLSSIVYRSFETKEKLAAQALICLKSADFPLCLNERKCPPSLQFSEIEKMLEKAAPTEGVNPNVFAKRIFEVFGDIDCLSISFRSTNDLLNFAPSEAQHHIDIPALTHFFTKALPIVKILKEEILACVRNSLKYYVKNRDLCKKNFKSIASLRVFVIYLLLPDLMEFENMEMLNEIAQVIFNLPEWAHPILKYWLSLLPQEIFINLISQLQQIISVFVADENSRFEEQLQTNLLARMYGLYKDPNYAPLENVVRLLEILYEANKISKIEKEILFKNSAISNAITVLFSYQTWKKNKESFSFCHYKFLLEVDFKAKILEEESRDEQELEKKRGLGVLSQLGPENPLGLLLAGDILYFNLSVRREHIIEDTLNTLNEKTQNTSFKKKLKVKFIGEPGVDEGGLKKEFFLILIKKLFDPQYGMFVEKMVMLFFS